MILLETTLVLQVETNERLTFVPNLVLKQQNLAENQQGLWSWRESNPRPNEEIISFLHAYLCLNFRAAAEPKPSTTTLSSELSPTSRGRRQLSPMSLHH